MPKGSHSDGDHFKEAIAQWQLQLQTELKRASSLPSAMFDACDPMLEARLAETTESLFRCLLEQEVPAAGEQPVERRLEVVLQAEMAALLGAAAQGHYPVEPLPDLEEHRDDEFFAILADTCCRSRGVPQQAAARLLRQASGVDADGVEALAASLAGRIVASADLTQLDPRALAATCHRIAALVAQAEPDPDRGGAQ